MKKLLLLLSVAMVFLACKKESPVVEIFIDKTISLDSTLIYPNKYEDGMEIGQFELDIDHDGIFDVIFKTVNYSSGRFFTNYSSIACADSFEIAYQGATTKTTSTSNNNGEIHTSYSYIAVDIPKILELSDTLSNGFPYTQDEIKIANYEHDMYQIYTSTTENKAWVGIGDRYIGLRNTTKNIFCQIKIRVIEYNKIMLICYKYTEQPEIWIISE